MALDATVGGVNSNSFCDRATADAYHTERLHNSEWTAASGTDKDAALIWASRILNEKEWVGTVASDSTQALRFPRTSMYDQDGRLLAEDTIPNFLVAATAELALYLLRDEDVKPEAPIKSDKVGPLTTEFFETSNISNSLPESVTQLIQFYLGHSSVNVKIERSG